MNVSTLSNVVPLVPYGSPHGKYLLIFTKDGKRETRRYSNAQQRDQYVAFLMSLGYAVVTRGQAVAAK